METFRPLLTSRLSSHLTCFRTRPPRIHAPRHRFNASPSRSQFTTALPPPPSSSLYLWSLTLGTAVGFYTIGALIPPHSIPLYRILYPPPSEHLQLLHPSSPEAIAYTQKKEEELFSLPIVTEMMDKHPDWKMSRPYNAISDGRRLNHLTAGVLHGPGKLAIPPLIFTSPEASTDPSSPNLQAIIILHLGRALCGHDGVIHGGLLATILDESLARQSFMSFEDKVVVTAKLEVNYKSPTWADQFVVIRTGMVEGEEIKGRKRWVKGSVEDLDGKKLVEAKALFVQPRMARIISNAKSVKEAIEETPVARN